jgi:predicted deacylase
MSEHFMSTGVHFKIADFVFDSTQTVGKHTFFLEFSTASTGEALGVPIMLVNGRKEGRTLVAIAGIHGDEYEGVYAIHEIFRRVNPDELSGRLIAIPIANLAAHRVCSRESPIDGLNLARVFPGRKNGSVSERIAHFLSESVIPQADFLIDLHSSGIKYLMPPLVGYERSDSDSGRKSQEAAFIFGTPTVWGHPGKPPLGRTVSEAHRLGIPWLYVESTGGGGMRTDELRYYTDGLLNLFRFLEMIPGAIDGKPIKFDLVGNGNIDEAITTDEAGFFVPMTMPLDFVSPNDVIGVVRDVFGNTISEIKADRSGYVVLIRSLPIVYPGDTVCVITAGEQVS